MSFIELQSLILAQIVIDIAIIIVFLVVLRRFRFPHKGPPLDKAVRVFESLLVEANKTAQQFKGQLEEKHSLIKSLNEQLDKRILSLNMIFNRAEVLLSRHRRNASVQTNPVDHDSHKGKIIELAEMGYKAEHIAKKLAIPKAEVKLVLDVKRIDSRISMREG
jgi:hypothetical protein